MGERVAAALRLPVARSQLHIPSGLLHTQWLAQPVRCLLTDVGGRGGEPCNLHNWVLSKSSSLGQVKSLPPPKPTSYHEVRQVTSCV